MTRQQWIDEFAAELAKWLSGDEAELKAIAEPRAGDGMRSSLTPAQQATSYKLRREQWVAEVIAGSKLPRLRASPAAVAFRDAWTGEFFLRLAASSLGADLAIDDPKRIAERMFVTSGATLMPGKAIEALRANGLPEEE
ncbi:MAG: hypothetical protein JWQ11_4077 [Rhizobacter sp.]|nr:hypothetical protein [Rhizobacter sp.]